MKTILATAAGGPSTLSFTRSLRDADPTGEKYRIIGTDCDPYNIHRADTDRSYLCPPASSPDYLPFLLKLIQDEQIDFIHSQPEIEAYTIGKYRREIEALGCKTFLPDQKTIELLRDKGRSAALWEKAGIKVPQTLLINNRSDLEAAFEKFGSEIWIRETIGAAGKGSLSRPSFETALAQIQSTDAWGRTVAAEHLTSRTVTWQSIWNKGELVVGQGRERLNWAFGNRAQSGVTGLTGIGKTVTDPSLDELSIRCVKAADDKPHGIFSVDFTYDSQGIPNPTEINIAKFFTTHHFISKTGCNMPQILVELAFGEFQGSLNQRNPCPPGWLWIRGIDIEPLLLRQEDISSKQSEFELRLQQLSK